MKYRRTEISKSVLEVPTAPRVFCVAFLYVVVPIYCGKPVSYEKQALHDRNFDWKISDFTSSLSFVVITWSRHSKRLIFCVSASVAFDVAIHLAVRAYCICLL